MLKERAIERLKQGDLLYMKKFEEFLNDRDVVEIAVRQNFENFKFASDELKNDFKLAVIALRQSPKAIHHVSPQLLADIRIATELVDNISAALYFKGIADSIKDDKDFMLFAVAKNGQLLQHASERLKQDRDVVFTAIDQDATVISYIPKQYDLLTAKQIDGFYNSDEVVLRAISKKGYLLGCGREAFRDDKSNVELAVSNYGCALEFASSRLKKDHDICRIAVAQDGYALPYVSPQVPNYKDICLVAVNQNGWAYKYVHKDFKNDVDIFKMAIDKMPFAVTFSPDDVAKNRDLMLYTMKKANELKDACLDVFIYVSKFHSSDQEICLEGLKSTSSAVQYFDRALLKNIDFLKKAVEVDKSITSVASIHTFMSENKNAFENAPEPEQVIDKTYKHHKSIKM